MISLILRHGYTLSDVDHCARLAAYLGPPAMPYFERHSLAWSAIAEHLYGDMERIAESDLIHAGRVAIWDALRSELQHCGYYRAHTDGSVHGAGSSPAFATYWLDVAVPAGSPEHYLLDGLAVSQILSTLSAHEQAALVALAAHGNYQDAAAALGLGYPTFRSQVSRARKSFLALWHQGEVPSKPWGCDRRAGVTAADRRRGGGRSAIDTIVRRKRAGRPSGGGTDA